MQGAQAAWPPQSQPHGPGHLGLGQSISVGLREGSRCRAAGGVQPHGVKRCGWWFESTPKPPSVQVPEPLAAYAYRPAVVALSAEETCCSLNCTMSHAHTPFQHGGNCSADPLTCCHMLTIVQRLALDTSLQDCRPAHSCPIASLAVCMHPMQSEHLPTQVGAQSIVCLTVKCRLLPSTAAPAAGLADTSFHLAAGINIFDTADSYVSASPEGCMSVLRQRAGQEQCTGAGRMCLCACLTVLNVLLSL